jgi:hypothetical protein
MQMILTRLGGGEREEVREDIPEWVEEAEEVGGRGGVEDGGADYSWVDVGECYRWFLGCE